MSGYDTLDTLKYMQHLGLQLYRSYDDTPSTRSISAASTTILSVLRNVPGTPEYTWSANGVHWEHLYVLSVAEPYYNSSTRRYLLIIVLTPLRLQ